MDQNTSDSEINKIPASAYALIAILAGAVGFFAIYVTFGPSGNAPPAAVEVTEAPKAEEPEPVKPAEPAEAPEPAVAAAITPGDFKSLNKGEMAALVIHPSPVETPAVGFQDGDGGERSLADWRGKVVLLNIWATWCAPCRKEMPALDELKAELGGDDFDVVAVSIDRGGLDKPRKFLTDIGVGKLELFNQSSGKLAPALKAFGMPTTLLLDRKGREIARLIGPAEWNSDDAKSVIRGAIALAPDGAGG